MDSILSSLGLSTAWERVEFFGIVTVVFGVLGECFLTLKKFPYNPSGFEHLEIFLWRTKKSWETIFSGIVVVGLAVELAAFLMVLKESHREILGLNQKVEELRQKNDEQGKNIVFLNNELSPRILNWLLVEEALKKYKSDDPKNGIRAIVISGPQEESKSLAMQISMPLHNLNWNVKTFTSTNESFFDPPNGGDRILITQGVTINFFPSNKSVEPLKSILYNEAAFDLLHAITNSGVQAIWLDWYTIPRGTVFIVVGQRPTKSDFDGLQRTGADCEARAKAWLDEFINRNNPKTNSFIK